jgi:hypothetical protein
MVAAIARAILTLIRGGTTEMEARLRAAAATAEEEAAAALAQVQADQSVEEPGLVEVCRLAAMVAVVLPHRPGPLTNQRRKVASSTELVVSRI